MLAAVQARLRSGFAFPVVVEEKVIGILEFFSLHTASPDEELAAARKQLQSNGETLAKFEIPMATEPAFVFKA